MVPGRFKKVYVEVTTACNLTCSFCPPTRRPRAMMTVDQFRRVAGQIAPATRHVHLHVKGEPLLHPGLEDILDVAQDAGLLVHIVTNGTLIGSKAELLLGHPAIYQVNISLHSFETGDGELYVGPVLGFARNAEQAGRPMVSLRFWTGPQAPLVKAVEREFSWAVPGTMVEGLAQGFELAPNLYVNFDREFAWPSLGAPVRSDTGFCLGLRDQVAVLVDGTVVPCCLDGEGAVPLGNLFTQDLVTIVRGPRAEALYRGFSENRCVEELCRRCEFRERFNREP